MTNVIGVIGSGAATSKEYEIAVQVGRLVARQGWQLVCGGLGGVMEGAAAGASEAGGMVIGILPGLDRRAANRYISIPIATGLGEGRNLLIVRTSDLLISVGGEYGTLSEIALALKSGTPVIGIHTWDIPGIVHVNTPANAVKTACEVLKVEPK